MLEKILEEIDRLHTKILNDKFACKVTEDVYKRQVLFRADSVS